MAGWGAGAPLAQPGMMPVGGQWPAASVQPMIVPNSMPMAYGGVQVIVVCTRFGHKPSFFNSGQQMRPGMVGAMVPPVSGVPVLPGAVPVLPTSTIAQRPVNPGLANTQLDPFGAL